jgi:hypothetical protein
MATGYDPSELDPRQGYDEEMRQELENMLYARHTEIKSWQDLEVQRGTNIPALFNQFYKFIQNPSSVSVETFKRMVDTDDTIGSGIDFLVTCLAARIGRYQHPSPEITEWVNKALEQMDGGWFNVLKEMLSASWAGFSVAEKVWANSQDGWIIKKMVPLPPATLLFETTRTGEITSDGILQYQRNYNPALFGAGTSYMFGFAGFVSAGVDNARGRPDVFARLGDLPFPLRSANTYAYMSIRIPREKVVHFSFDAQGKFGNPYGRSLLRRCYKDYVFKHTTYQMLSTALDRKGTPLTLVYADNNTTLLNQKNYQPGVPAQKQAPGVNIRADLAAHEAFKNIHNDSVIVLPGKKGQIFDTDFVNQQSNAGDFIAAIEMHNKAILRSLLIPPLVFSGGDGSGSYALGQTHEKTWEKILDGYNAGLAQVLLQDVIQHMLAFNFPIEQWRKDGLGSFSKRELTQDEKQKEAALLEQGVNMGAIDMNDINDLNKVREILGFEARDTLIEHEDPFDEGGDGETGGDGEQPTKPNTQDGSSGAGSEAGKKQSDRAGSSDSGKGDNRGLKRLRGLFKRRGSPGA